MLNGVPMNNIFDYIKNNKIFFFRDQFWIDKILLEFHHFKIMADTKPPSIAQVSVIEDFEAVERIRDL